MSEDFKRIVSDIHTDAEKYKDDDCFTIEKETDTSISVWDFIDDIYDRFYTITDTDVMDEKWLLPKIITTPYVKERIDISKIVDWILNVIPKENYQNLNRLIFVYDEDKDFDYLYELFESDDYETNYLDTNTLSCNDSLGIQWYEYSCIVINVGNIEKSTRKLIDDGIIFSFEEEQEIHEQILITIAHEIRHLAQSNPYLTETIKFHGDPEEDAESFARALV